MIVLCCSPDNDLWRILERSGLAVQRYDRPRAALKAASPGSAVLLLGDVPAGSTDDDLADARRQGQRLYIECPGAMGGVALSPPVEAAWERVAVMTGVLGPDLPPGRLLSASGPRGGGPPDAVPWLTMARMAGFDTAVFGVPEDAVPVLFEADGDLIATLPLSRFVTGRFEPFADWLIVWRGILAWLGADGARAMEAAEPRVRPTYGPHETLPPYAERRARDRAATWVFRSRLLPSRERHAEIARLLAAGTEAAPAPPAETAAGDGTFGIQEGYESAIQADGSQRQRLPIRADCQAETAAALAMAGGERNISSARRLLDYLYFTSGLCGGARGNPEHPAFGLIAWGAHSPAWEVANYGDDNARALLASMLAAARLGSDAWDAPMLRALLANLRTTGRRGFRGRRLDVPDLEEKGWRAFAEADTLHFAPHYEAYLWACFLWAFRATRHEPFYITAASGIRAMMERYPNGWALQDNSERAQMLLPLAWLARMENSDGARDSLTRVAGDLIALQEPCGAIPERMHGTGDEVYRFPASNAEYGLTETPLIQRNGDPASDQLYTAGFALLGLHEAAATTGDPALAEAENRLAEYLCRIQVRADGLPELDGAWFRAFDYQRWDYWASSADAGWGAWCIESGWGQAWIAAVLGLRAEGTTFWEFTAHSRIASHLSAVKAEMSRNTGAPWRSEQATTPGGENHV